MSSILSREMKVDYEPKAKRLVVQAPFHMVDICRNFPSRRFDPKRKVWVARLVRPNVEYLKSLNYCDIKYSKAASDAITNFEILVAPPRIIPFPVDTYIDHFDNKDPYPHQSKMLDLSWGLRSSAWFCEMGTGKTFAAIHYAQALYLAGEIDAVAIVCPATLRRTWMKELKKYASIPYDFRMHETKAPWLTGFYSPKDTKHMKILAISVEGLGISQQSYDSVCGFYPGRRVLTICDESSRIKNPDAVRTKRTIELGGASERRIILNGTPIALGIQDLWSQYEFLDPNIIGSGDYWAFKTRYIVYGGFENRQIIGYQNVDELMDLIRPYTCEFRKKDVLQDLPPKIPKTVFVQASKDQKVLFHQILAGKATDTSEIRIKSDNVLEKILRLRQVVGGFVPSQEVVPSGDEKTVLKPFKINPKLDTLLELIEEHRDGSKFIIWAAFVHEIEAIANKLRTKYGDAAVATYYGATDQDERSRIEDAYCRSPELRFFIGNPTAAGLGLTLVSGESDIMVYYSGTNAYIDRAQSEDRAHRIGQRNSVVIIDLVMEDSVDEAIQESIVHKTNVDTYVKDQISKGVKMVDVLTGELEE